MITVPQLSYSGDALAPHISENTISFHYGKHHQGYAKKLNAILESLGDTFKEMDSVETILTSIDSFPAEVQNAVLNNAGQVYNHTLYWESMAANLAAGEIDGNDLIEKIDDQYGSLERFFEAWKNSGTTLFGSGWVWLVKKSDGSLAIEKTINADTPILRGDTCILVMDVWEHAYYLDYQNDRGAYIDAFMNCIDWDKANKRFTI